MGNGEAESRKGLRKTCAYLRALQQGDITEAVRSLIAKETKTPVLINQLTKRTGFSQDSLKAAASALATEGLVMVFGSDGYFSRRHFQGLKDKILEAVKRVHPALSHPQQISKTEVRRRCAPELHAPIFEKVIKELINEGKLLLRGQFILPVGSPCFLTDKQQRIVDNILKHAATSRFTPFSADSAWKNQPETTRRGEVQNMLDFLCFKKDLVRLCDSRFLTTKRSRDCRYLATHKLNRIQKMLVRHTARNNPFSLSQTKHLLKTSRTSAVRILEHLDAVGFTMRSGNARVIRDEVLQFQSLGSNWHGQSRPREHIEKLSFSNRHTGLYHP